MARAFNPNFKLCAQCHSILSVHQAFIKTISRELSRCVRRGASGSRLLCGMIQEACRWASKSGLPLDPATSLGPLLLSPSRSRCARRQAHLKAGEWLLKLCSGLQCVPERLRIIGYARRELQNRSGRTDDLQRVHVSRLAAGTKLNR